MSVKAWLNPTHAVRYLALLGFKSTAQPKEKATKPFHPHLLPKDAWFDPINLEKERFKEEDEGKNRQTESWHSFGTF
jgi:hypothetical protein